MAKSRTIGTKLLLGDGAGPPEGFTEVAQLRNIGGLDMTRETLDVTDHQSPDDNREFIGTWADPGGVEFEGMWDPTNATHDEATGLLARFLSNSVNTYQVEWPFATPYKVQFSAIVENLAMGQADLEGVIPISGRLKISGAINFGVT